MPKTLVRERSPISTKWGKSPSERTMEEILDAGLINLDKPQGPTSHQVTAWVRDILGLKRIGHGGTLDPKVSGVLPIATGRATRAVDITLKTDKEYVCAMKLHKDKNEGDLRRVISSFVGDIYQTPPVRSAVKRQMRVRTVHSIVVLEIQGRMVLFRVTCDAGTYIRTLCVDIGEALGVGGQMEDLRRVRSGNMKEEESVQLQDIKDAYVLWKEEGDEKWLREIVRPFEVLFAPLPKIVIKDSAVDAICRGADLAVVGIARLDDTVRNGSTVAIMSEKGEGIAMAIARMNGNQILELREGIAAETERVFMKPGTYPSMW
ncbi:MAG: RNA-guided pseudouridylation complex pseudouridine synthase subunit Cbf5 [Methanomassiliicoccales archaeon]|nr:RNA-guided pseudouridylation complex pseudouridine synthase subunit Cbf5 [Methanomassiliicoccales archaeon]